uniref:Uncharacterized protein n=1 Tax=Magallana gigas TaxID=29159 RepID=A0A8W8HM56_MAGGI
MSWYDLDSNVARKARGETRVSRQVVSVGPPAHQGRQSQQVEVAGGPLWPFFVFSLGESSMVGILLGTFFFFFGGLM